MCINWVSLYDKHALYCRPSLSISTTLDINYFWKWKKTPEILCYQLNVKYYWKKPRDIILLFISITDTCIIVNIDIPIKIKRQFFVSIWTQYIYYSRHENTDTIYYIILWFIYKTDIIVNISIQIKQKKRKFFVSICTDVSIFNQCVSYTRRYNDKH